MRNYIFLCLHLVVECVANLLKLDTYQFADSLTQRFMVLRGEQITTPLTIEQVSNLVTAVYIYSLCMHVLLLKSVTSVCANDNFDFTL